jgi:quercetin dioxygenase-like cupin family protein
MHAKSLTAVLGGLDHAELLHDDGKRIAIVDDAARIIIRGNKTNDAFTAGELYALPGKGPMPHTHPVAEMFMVLEGEIDFYGMVDGKWTNINAKPGSVVYVPSGVPHHFHGGGKVPSRALVTFENSSFDNFFLEASRPATAGNWIEVASQPADLDKVIAAAQKYGLAPYDPAMPWTGDSVKYYAPDSGDKFIMLNTFARFMAKGSANNGMGAVDVLVLPNDGVPLHSHRFAELFFVLDGEVTYETLIDGRRAELKARPSDAVWVPGNAPHGYSNRSNKPARFIAIPVANYTDDIEQIFREAGAPASGPQDLLKRGIVEPDAASIGRVVAAAVRAGMNFDY